MHPTAAFLKWKNIFEAFHPIILCKQIMLSCCFPMYFCWFELFMPKFCICQGQYGIVVWINRFWDTYDADR